MRTSCQVLPMIFLSNKLEMRRYGKDMLEKLTVGSRYNVFLHLLVEPILGILLSVPHFDAGSLRRG